MMILEKGREKFYTASLLTFHPSFHQHSKGRRNMIVGMGMVRDTKCSEEPGSNNVPSAIVIFSFLVFYFLWFLDNQNTFYFIVGWQRIIMLFFSIAVSISLLCLLTDIEVGIISRVSDKHCLGFDKDHNEAVGGCRGIWETAVAAGWLQTNTANVKPLHFEAVLSHIFPRETMMMIAKEILWWKWIFYYHVFSLLSHQQWEPTSVLGFISLSCF